MPRTSTAVGLGSWALVGGGLLVFLVQDPAFQLAKDLVSPPPPEDEAK